MKIRVARVCLPRGLGGELLNRPLALEVEIRDGNGRAERSVELVDGASPESVAAGVWIAAEEVD